MAEKKLPKETLKEYIDLFETSNLASLEVQIKDVKVSLKAFDEAETKREKEGPSKKAQTGKNEETAFERSSESEKEDHSYKEVLSPIAGTYYAAPSVNSSAFVIEGSIVKKGDVVCIVESMKVMNQIKSQYDGKVVRTVVNNGEPVNKNDILMYIE